VWSVSSASGKSITIVSPGCHKYFLLGSNQNNSSCYPVSCVLPLSIAVKAIFSK
jgi:hypothetical protein